MRVRDRNPTRSPTLRRRQLPATQAPRLLPPSESDFVKSLSDGGAYCIQPVLDLSLQLSQLHCRHVSSSVVGGDDSPVGFCHVVHSSHDGLADVIEPYAHPQSPCPAKSESASGRLALIIDGLADTDASGMSPVRGRSGAYGLIARGWADPVHRRGQRAADIHRRRRWLAVAHPLILSATPSRLAALGPPAIRLAIVTYCLCFGAGCIRAVPLPVGIAFRLASAFAVIAA